tara:strand:- start:41 stop:274 length:234 start_codon:yes stop_codon:yes gene_type:complete
MATTYSGTELKVGEGWRYSEPQMKLRAEALLVLLKHFGDGEYPNQSIYDCANEWVRKGHATTSGLVSYYKAYYTLHK